VISGPSGDGGGERSSGRRSRLGWLGVLTGPVAWAVQLYGDWLLGEVVGCAPATRARGTVLGLQVGQATGLLSAVVLAITVASGVLSFLELRTVRREGDDTIGSRAAWVATAGVMTSVLFSIVIATSFLAVAFGEGCR
jgi:hypothetical protein